MINANPVNNAMSEYHSWFSVNQQRTKGMIMVELVMIKTLVQLTIQCISHRFLTIHVFPRKSMFGVAQ